MRQSRISLKDISKKPFEYSVNLPKTKFPMRANAVHNEGKFRHRCTTYLYDWQLRNNRGKDFYLHDGPPYANGELHMGHALNKCLKDMICRYHVLRGDRVHYRPGWDCHGLPIELKALSAHKSDNSDPLKTRQIAKNFALKTMDKQSKDFQRWAIMGEWDNPYRTLSPAYEADQLKIFNDMFKKGLIYRSHKPVYWSPSSKTALAESELEYNENHVSRSVYVSFPVDNPRNSTIDKSFLVWTTTPWTIPSNRALAVNKSMDYVEIAFDDSPETRFILAKGLLDTIEEIYPARTFQITDYYHGKDLEGLGYYNPVSHYKGKVLTANFVTDTAGTGVVHLAPGHGFDDYEVCKNHGIKTFCPVDEVGNYTDEAGKLSGMNIFGEGTETIIELLQSGGHLFGEKSHVHSYPYDWRTKKPVIIRSTSQWFADVESIKNRVVELIDRAEFIPASGKKRLISHVQSRNEWCISRQRNWGVPIPAFYEKDTGKEFINDDIIDFVIKLIAEHGSDEWWQRDVSGLLPESMMHMSDKLEKGRDTMDVWFDSGSSWSILDDKIADVYLEGSDQHRGWFQSSVLTRAACKTGLPFKKLITHGFVMDSKGRKMSKSLGNVVDPAFITELGKNKNLKKNNLGLGVDVMRLWIASSDYTRDILVGEDVLKYTAESLRKLRNTMRFMLSNLYDFSIDNAISGSSLHPIDLYMLRHSNTLFKDIQNQYSRYDFPKVHQSLLYLASNELSSFYLDLVKDRLYNDWKNSHARRSAQTVLCEILKNFMLACSPITPHLSEEVFEFLQPILKLQSKKSVFELGWYDITRYDTADEQFDSDFDTLRQLRQQILKSIEDARSEKLIKSSIEAFLEISCSENSAQAQLLRKYQDILPEIFQCADVTITYCNEAHLSVRKSEKHRCIRCWKHVAESPETPCVRCRKVISKFPSP